MDPALWELLRSRAERDDQEVEAVIRLDDPHVDVPRVRLVSRFGPIATCRLRKDAILSARGDENVLSLKASRALGQERDSNDGSLSELPTVSVDRDIRRPSYLAATGAHVCVGIVDWGCDVDCAAFQKSDGSTRLLALFNQGGSTAHGSPSPYGYGTIYSSREINDALATGYPYEALGYHPADADRDGSGAHGTFVMDIAAGNGHAGGPVGIAPEADLIFVHLADRGTAGLANLGDSVRILEAVDFIARTAGQRPWVINLSIGRHGGPHDGRTLLELALDYLIRAAPGRCIVQSAGNYFDKSCHASGRLQAGEIYTLSVITNEADVTPNELEVWYSGQDEFLVQLESPAGVRFPPVRLGEQADIIEDDRIVGRLYHRYRDPNNLDNHIDLFLYPWARAGLWSVTLEALRAANGTFHAWVERDEFCEECQAHFPLAEADPFSTIGTIANGHTLAVGAFDARSPTRQLAHFSSAGPTRVGQPKPDLVAPGVRVLAARSAPRGSSRSVGMLARKSGTSFAAPHVTGAVALCLQAAPRPLTSAEIRALVLDSAEPASSNGSSPSRFGRGYLNIGKAFEAAFALNSRARRPSVYRSISPSHRDHPAEEREMQQLDLEQAVRVSLGPDRLYREVVYRRGGPLDAWIEEAFLVLARPGEPPNEPPEAGDVLVRVALGEPSLGHLAVLSDSTLTPHHALEEADVRSERGSPGFYATVVEGGTFAHEHLDRYARRVVDAAGRVPLGQLLLRPRRSLQNSALLAQTTHTSEGAADDRPARDGVISSSRQGPAAQGVEGEEALLERLRNLVSDQNQAFLIERGADIYLVAEQAVGETVPGEVAFSGLFPYGGRATQPFHIRRLKTRWREKVRKAELPMITIPAEMEDWQAWISPPWFHDPMCDYLLCDPAKRIPRGPAVDELVGLANEVREAASGADHAIDAFILEAATIHSVAHGVFSGIEHTRDFALAKAEKELRRLEPLVAQAQRRVVRELGDEAAKRLGLLLARRLLIGLGHLIPVVSLALLVYDVAKLTTMLAEFVRGARENTSAGILRQARYPEFNSVGSCPDFTPEGQFRMSETSTGWKCGAPYPPGSPPVEGYALDTEEEHRGAVVQYSWEYMDNVPEFRKSRLNPFTGLWDRVPLPKNVRRNPSSGQWEVIVPAAEQEEDFASLDGADERAADVDLTVGERLEVFYGVNGAEAVEEADNDVESPEVERAEAEAFIADQVGFEEGAAAGVTFPSGATLAVVAGPTGEGEEHFDPNRTGNPLLDTRNKSTELSANFSAGELVHSGGRTFDRARIDPELVRCLQKLRDHVGRPVRITSGYRPYLYNVDLYANRYKKRPTLSRHSSGQAADVNIADMSGMEIAKAAIDACGTEIGVGIDSSYAHVDVRGKWARWTYFERDKARSDRVIAELDAYRQQRLGGTRAPAAVTPVEPAAPAAPPGVRFRRVRDKGYAAYGGGRLEDALRRVAATGGLTISPRDIDTLQRIADVESSGLANAINSWDNAVMSAGFKQWTVRWGELQDLISRAPEAFARHGIRLAPPGSNYTFQSKGKVWTQRAIDGVPNKETLRSEEWARRFYLAALEPESLAAAATKALEEIRELEQTVRHKYGWSPHLESSRGRALLAELENNRPAYVRTAVRRTLARTAERPGIDEDAFLKIFVEEIVAVYQANENDAEKGRRWTRKIMRTG
jgi:subtilisin family serine protease